MLRRSAFFFHVLQRLAINRTAVTSTRLEAHTLLCHDHQLDTAVTKYVRFA